MKEERFDRDGRSRGYYSTANRVNDLTGKEWLFWTRSVITKAYPANMQHRLRSQHGGQKPPDLCADLIAVFSKAGQWVLDPFMGVGGTLLGASLAGRRAVGVDLEGRWIDVYREVCRREGLEEMEAHAGDAGDLLPRMDRTFDLILTDVPYWKMDRSRRSPGRFKRVGEPSTERRKSKLQPFAAAGFTDKAQWLQKMSHVFRESVRLLKADGYLLVFIGDMYCDNRYHCLSAELARELEGIEGLAWKANLIWYDVSKSLHLYGYQYSYIPSMIHQNILVFRNETQRYPSRGR